MEIASVSEAVRDAGEERRKTDSKLILDEVNSASFSINGGDSPDHSLRLGGTSNELDFVVGRDMQKSDSILDLDVFRVGTAQESSVGVRNEIQSETDRKCVGMGEP